MVRFRGRTRKGAKIEMIPLIDVIFLLLAAFLIAQRFMTVHEGLRIDLPEAASAETADDEGLLVTITEAGGIEVGRDPASDEDLVRRVSEAKARDEDIHVLVNAHGSVPHRRIVEVLDAIRRGGVTSLTILTDPASSR